MDPSVWPGAPFLLLATLACASAVAVVLSYNVVRMALYLIVCLASTAGLFLLAGADFVGVTQLMIYVGGTVVLLVFGVMLTSQAQYVRMKAAPHELALAALVAGALLLLIGWGALRVEGWNAVSSGPVAVFNPEPQQTAAPIGLALMGVRPDSPPNAAAGQPGAAGYALPFELLSIHLLVALVGSAYLARAKKRVPSAGPTIGAASPRTQIQTPTSGPTS